VIRNINADGFGSLYPRYKGGRPPKFTLAQRREIKKIAGRCSNKSSCLPTCTTHRPTGVGPDRVEPQGRNLKPRGVFGGASSLGRFATSPLHGYLTGGALSGHVGHYQC
jgi:hypothetical protein